MQGEQRYLDGEREEERREQPPRDAAERAGVTQEVQIAERIHACRPAGMEVQHENRHEHKQRAEERIDEELDGRIEPVLAAPDPDDEIHGDEHHFPHHVEEEEIERDEYTDHAGGHDQQQRIEAIFALRDVAPAPQNRQRHQEGGEEHQEERNPVHAHRVANPPCGDPRVIGDELQTGSWNERPPQRNGDGKLDQAAHERHMLRRPAGNQHDDRPGDQRPGEQRGESPGPVHQLMARHRSSSTPTRNTAT